MCLKRSHLGKFVEDFPLDLAHGLAQSLKKPRKINACGRLKIYCREACWFESGLGHQGVMSVHSAGEADLAESPNMPT